MKTNKFDFKTEEERLEYLKKIIAFFQDERGEEIGLVAAGEVLDFFLNTMGDDIYKKALGDTKKIVKDRTDDMLVELNMLGEK